MSRSIRRLGNVLALFSYDSVNIFSQEEEMKGNSYVSQLVQTQTIWPQGPTYSSWEIVFYRTESFTMASWREGDWFWLRSRHSQQLDFNNASGLKNWQQKFQTFLQ
jgi:hypothetical protein